MPERRTPAATPASLLAFSAAALALLIYLPALAGGFAYDDAIIVVNHPQVTGHDWGAIWTSPYHVGPTAHVATGAYRPLTIASLALDHTLFGAGPMGFHTTNLLWNALVTALVVLFARRLGMTDGSALAGGILFAVHPVHVEAVAAIAGRSDLLASAFALGAALCALPGPEGRARPALAGALVGLALFAKEAALPVVVLLPCLPWLGVAEQGADRAAARRASLRVAVASAAAAAIYLVARRLVLGALAVQAGGVSFYENPLVGQTLVTRLLTVAGLFARAVGLLVAPVRLSPDYGFAVVEPARGPLEGPVLAGALLLAGLAAAAWIARERPRVLFLLAWCLATWAIVSNLLTVIGTPMAERQLYLPSVGVCLLAALLFESAARRFGARVAAAVLAVVALAAVVRTTTWTRAWSSDATLFEAALASAPRSIRVLGNLAVERADAGRLPEARELLERAVTIAPEFVPNLINLAGVQLDLHDVPAAMRTAARAVAADPRSATAHAQLGLAQAAAGDLAAAEGSLGEAVRLDPNFTDARRRLAEVRARRAPAARP